MFLVAIATFFKCRYNLLFFVVRLKSKITLRRCHDACSLSTKVLLLQYLRQSLDLDRKSSCEVGGRWNGGGAMGGREMPGDLREGREEREESSASATTFTSHTKIIIITTLQVSPCLQYLPLPL